MRLIVTVATVVFCLFAMGVTAYAYFSSSTSSVSNFIKAANFEAGVKVQIENENGNELTLTSVDAKTQEVTLEAGETYYVTLTPGSTSTAKTGFVTITAEGKNESYHTQQLGKDGEKTTPSVSFYLSSVEGTRVTFLSHWGTSSRYGYESSNDTLYITQGDTVEIPAGETTEKKSQTSSKETTHTVAAGENLSVIAAIYGITVDRLASYNNISDPNVIYTGQVIRIPPAD